MAGGFLNRWSRRKSGEQLEPKKNQRMSLSMK